MLCHCCKKYEATIKSYREIDTITSGVPNCKYCHILNNRCYLKVKEEGLDPKKILEKDEMTDKILNEGTEILNWACDLGEDGEVESNGGVERLIKYKDKYYKVKWVPECGYKLYDPVDLNIEK